MILGLWLFILRVIFFVENVIIAVTKPDAGTFVITLTIDHRPHGSMTDVLEGIRRTKRISGMLFIIIRKIYYKKPVAVDPVAQRKSSKRHSTLNVKYHLVVTPQPLIVLKSTRILC